jgi:hypothetical protein
MSIRGTLSLLYYMRKLEREDIHFRHTWIVNIDNVHVKHDSEKR